MLGGHQSRPFSPYRHGPTQEDLLNAAVRGRALVIPEEPEKEHSVASMSPSKTPSRHSKPLSYVEEGKSIFGGRALVIPEEPEKEHSVASTSPSKTPSRQSKVLSYGKPLSQLSPTKQPSAVASHTSRPGRLEVDRDLTPTPSRPRSPGGLDDEEARIVNVALAAQTPRTSIYAAPLEPEIAKHFHDMELCVLLHQENDPAQHEIVKKALRKAVRQRVKKLGMKYDNEVCSWPRNFSEHIANPLQSIQRYRKSYHDHDPSIHLRADYLPEVCATYRD